MPLAVGADPGAEALPARAPVYSVAIMYNAALATHSWLRWAVLLLGLLAIGRALAGQMGRKPWNGTDDRTARFFTTALDVQMLLGVLLYFALSPITGEGMRNMGAAMGNAGMRFWTIEHPFGMLLALALAHVGRARVRKTADAVRRHRVALIFFTLAMIAILATIPWPGRLYGRPLVRLLTF
jgi:hypothetical protein